MGMIVLAVKKLSILAVNTNQLKSTILKSKITEYLSK